MRHMHLLVLLTITVAIVNGENLLFTPNQWYATTDNYGSDLDTTDALIVDDTLAVKFSLTAKKPNTDWPYVEAVYESKSPLSGTDSIKVTYKCDSNLVIKFNQTELGEDGLGSYAFYETTLPKSPSKWTTKSVALSSFKQPDWADSKDKEIKLNLDHSSRIYFVPNICDQTGGVASVSLKEIILIED